MHYSPSTASNHFQMAPKVCVTTAYRTSLRISLEQKDMWYGMTVYFVETRTNPVPNVEHMLESGHVPGRSGSTCEIDHASLQNKFNIGTTS